MFFDVFLVQTNLSPQIEEDGPRHHNSHGQNPYYGYDESSSPLGDVVAKTTTDDQQPKEGK